MKKSKVIIFLLLTCIVISLALPAFAVDTPSTGKPSGITYGDRSSYGRVEYMGPWLSGKWNYYGYEYFRDGWDSDTFNCTNAAANVTLSTTSTSTYSISGSTEFNFANVAKVGLSGTIGTSWSKTSTVTYNATAGYKYTLWSANVIESSLYQYDKSGSAIYFGDKIIYARANDKYGTEKWFFRTKS